LTDNDAVPKIGQLAFNSFDNVGVFRLQDYCSASGIANDVLELAFYQPKIHRHDNDSGFRASTDDLEIFSAVFQQYTNPITLLDTEGKQGIRQSVNAVIELAKCAALVSISDSQIVRVKLQGAAENIFKKHIATIRLRLDSDLLQHIRLARKIH
jgi:hypothetical protein